mmetsp:Transcript_56120/g.112433  ORF Transcript_56120/g.112433 Transcript_56120/m.112433 type:complete len:239 (+) Transcript_56120:107-823(+)
MAVASDDQSTHALPYRVEEDRPHSSLCQYFVGFFAKEDKPPVYTLADVSRAREIHGDSGKSRASGSELLKISTDKKARQHSGRKHIRETGSQQPGSQLRNTGKERKTPAGNLTHVGSETTKYIKRENGIMLPKPQVGLRLFLSGEIGVSEDNGALVEVVVEHHYADTDLWAIKATAGGEFAARGLLNGADGHGMEVLSKGKPRVVTSDSLRWYIRAKPALHQRHNEHLLDLCGVGVAI